MRTSFFRLFACLAVSGTVRTASAQLPQLPLQVEGRLDGLFARTSGVEGGIGLSVPVGLYARTGLVGGIGAGSHGVEGRTDLIARFSLDPFRQSRWAPYVGGGIWRQPRLSVDLPGPRGRSSDRSNLWMGPGLRARPGRRSPRRRHPPSRDQRPPIGRATVSPPVAVPVEARAKKKGAEEAP